jgi:hypothetical protein
MVRIEIRRVIKRVAEGKVVTDHVGLLSLSPEDDFNANISSWACSGSGERLAGTFALPNDEKRLIAEAVKKGLLESKNKGEVAGFIWRAI